MIQGWCLLRGPGPPRSGPSMSKKVLNPHNKILSQTSKGPKKSTGSQEPKELILMLPMDLCTYLDLNCRNRPRPLLGCDMHGGLDSFIPFSITICVGWVLASTTL